MLRKPPIRQQNVKTRPSAICSPFVYVGLGLNGFLNAVGKRREKVDTGYPFNLVYGVHVIAFRAVALRVLIDEAYRLGVIAQTEHDLEEGFRHNHLVATYRLVPAFVQDRAANNVNSAVLLGPLTARHLHFVPVAAVKVAVLRAHVGEKERLFHSLLAKLVVCRRTHVATVVTRPVIVGILGTRDRHVRVSLEINTAALGRTGCAVGSKMPSLPVGLFRFLII